MPHSPRMPTSETAAIAQALGAPARLAILRALLGNGDPQGMSVAELARAVDRSERSVVDHVRRLRKLGVIAARRQEHAARLRFAESPVAQAVIRMLAALDARGAAGHGGARKVVAPAELTAGLKSDPLVRRLLDILPLNILLWEVGQGMEGEPEFTVALVNAAYLAARENGERAADIEGRDYALVAPEQVRETTLEQLRRVRATGEPVLGQVVDHADQQSQPRHYLRHLVPIFDDRRVVRLIVGMTMDVTERVQAETLLAEKHEQLSAALEQRDAFVAMASHELKTPLSALLANLQLTEHRLDRVMGEQPEGPLRDLRVRQRKAITEARRIAGLVDELLDVGRIQAGKLEMNVAPCDLVGVVREVVEEQRELTGRDIRTDWTEGPVMVQGDAARLAQVVSNLLTNAVKYAPADRPVFVGISAPEGEVVLSVRDEGQGIAEADQERIFDRFYRVRGAHAYGGSDVGLGLGLSITSEIVQRHGGRIWVESAPGKGATFSVALPLG